MSKIITHKDKQGKETEYYSKTLNDVLHKLKGKEGTLTLSLWFNGIFVKEALIGDLKDNLNGEDYYKAYCIVTS